MHVIQPHGRHEAVHIVHIMLSNDVQYGSRLTTLQLVGCHTARLVFFFFTSQHWHEGRLLASGLLAAGGIRSSVY